MTQTTDDPAIPQQGPVETYALKNVWGNTGASEFYNIDVIDQKQFLPFARRIDAAFDALESALREIAAAMKARASGLDDDTVFDVIATHLDAALALAEAVRS